MPTSAPRFGLPQHLPKLLLWVVFVVLTLPWWGGLVFEVTGRWNGPRVPPTTTFAPVWSPEGLGFQPSVSSPLDEHLTAGVMLWRHADLKAASSRAHPDVIGQVRQMLDLPVLHPGPSHDQRLAQLDAGLKVSGWRMGWPPSFHAVAGQTPLMVAQQELEKAVQETGLAGVWVPPAIAEDAVLLLGLAANLRQANEELQFLTGWEGGVLGLGGRVVWWPIQPQQVGLGGRAWTDSTGLTHVAGSWVSLAHEWFHALDHVVAQDSYRYPINGLGSTQQMSMWGRSRHSTSPHEFSVLRTALHEVAMAPAQVDALQAEVKARALWKSRENVESGALVLGSRWSSTIATLAEMEQSPLRVVDGSVKGPWLQWRNAAASKLMLGTPDHGAWVANIHPGYLALLRPSHQAPVYLLDPGETLAYAFEGQTMLGETPLLASGQEDWASALLHPTSAESQLHTPVFQLFFANLGPWWTRASTRTQVQPSL